MRRCCVRRASQRKLPVRIRRCSGAEHVDEVVMVDQTQIGRTTRSNPASYVGAFDAIRKRFAGEAVSIERGYTVGTFSFNSGNGRCPTCGGNGFEHVEMQFLSDVYLRCPDCDGRRYRPEILDVKMMRGDGPARSIADVLDMTVSTAAEFFAGDREILACLEPLVAVGLDYLRLGQPVPTLSGGEAQRLKLAGHLVSASTTRSAGRSLFLFDEPTTGLHFDDVAKLLGAFKRLLDAGHSLVVIEHNLDVIRAADWILDLGPEGGDAGGELLAAGTPQDIMACTASHTGRALVEYEQERQRVLADGRAALPAAIQPVPLRVADRGRDAIVVHRAREHNLRDVDVSIPRDGMTVVTGVSGSGKSTLAFDIVFAEGQRRYLESLNAYARQFVQPSARPDVDAIYGIPPTVAIEQRTSRGGRKSTVGTLTEVHHFLRLLYVKLGVQHCPDCATAIEPQTADAIAARLLRECRGRTIELLAPLIVSRKGYYTDLAKWALGKGYAGIARGWRAHSDRTLAASRSLQGAYDRTAYRRRPGGGEERAQPARRAAARARFRQGCRARPRSRQGARVLDAPRVCFLRPQFCRARPAALLVQLEARLVRDVLRHRRTHHGLRCGTIRGRDLVERVVRRRGQCVPEMRQGSVSNPVALNVMFRGRSIAELTGLPVDAAFEFFAGLKLQGREAGIARDLNAEIRSRLAFLRDVGLGYISLDRAAPTLSGGEAQRIRLASQLGSNLRGVCYVLDEPTIGLHPRDNAVLLDALDRLARKGNTLLVVEHDEDTIRRADHVIDLGPGAGSRGGRVVGAGRLDDLIAAPESITGRFLANPLRHPLAPRRPVSAQEPALEIKGATLHNLRKVNARIPFGRLTVVTGVSGSGKSTLARDVLYANLCARLAGQRVAGDPHPFIGCDEHRRLGVARPRARGRPDADRQDAAFVPRHLCRFLGRDPQGVRGGDGCARARLHRQSLFIQHVRRSLRKLRRAGRADDRDELPAGREGALRHVRRQALQRGDADVSRIAAATSAKCWP